MLVFFFELKVFFKNFVSGDKTLRCEKGAIEMNEFLLVGHFSNVFLLFYKRFKT